MPKIKSRKVRNPAQRVLDVMAYHQSRLELSHKELAVKIAIPYGTLLRREKHPEMFTVGELTRISNAFDISLTDLILGYYIDI